MQIDPDVVAVIAVATAVITVVLLVVVVVLILRLRVLRRTYTAAIGDAPPDDLVGAIASHARRLDQATADLRTIHANTETLREVQRGAIARLGLVRYDAFPDMGGMLSFSAALLDEHGDGIVISAINGRTETRAYAKPIENGSSDHLLSDEERSAVKAAIDGGRGKPLTTPGPRRGRR